MQDVKNATAIFGPDVGTLKGKTTHSKPHRVKPIIVDLPPEIQERYERVTMSADIMFVNSIPFFMSISKHIKFGTAGFLPNRKDNHISQAFTSVYTFYRQQGFQIVELKMDGEFKSLRKFFAEKTVTLNCFSHGEHVPEIERLIRTVKERCCGVFNTLPFTAIPARMTVELVTAATFWLNVFPPLGGASEHINPRELMSGVKIDYKCHCQVKFGEYVQTHKEGNNTMASRTLGAIALRPTGNHQGGHYF